MARALHLFVVVSGLSMMAEGVIALFYQPGWMVQQNAITIRGLAAAVALGFTIAILDRVRGWISEVVGRRLDAAAQVDANLPLPRRRYPREGPSEMTNAWPLSPLLSSSLLQSLRFNFLILNPLRSARAKPNRPARRLPLECRVSSDPLLTSFRGHRNDWQPPVAGLKARVALRCPRRFLHQLRTAGSS
jgi:hypothetical protein